jgi:clan AA aspartic protease
MYPEAGIDMGYVKVRAKIGDPEQTRVRELEFLVDTGASYMVIPPSVAEELGLKPIKKGRVTLADNREVDAGYAFAYVSLLGREAPATVLVFESPMPLLGTFTLRVLSLEVDPAKEEVRHSRPFALGLMHMYCREENNEFGSWGHLKQAGLLLPLRSGHVTSHFQD